MKTKKILSLLLGFTVAASSLGIVGCVHNGPANGATDIEIVHWNDGWGNEWLNKIIEEFTKKYPQYTVTLDSSPNNGFAYAENIENGDINTTDLYICSFENIPCNNEYTEILDDLYDAVPDGERMTLADKMGAELAEGMKYPDGHRYAVPGIHGVVMGLVYNADIIDGVKYKVPNTTDELIDLTWELANDIDLIVPTGINKGNKIYPFIHYGTGDYWKRIYTQWQIQYDGLDYYYNNLLSLTDAEGNTPSKEVMLKQDGRYEAMLVLDELISQYTVFPGSNNLTYTLAQTQFMNNAAVMMANGNWLINEMKSNTEATATNLKMMRTPVISSIIDKCPTIENDAELSALIEKIDSDVAANRPTSTSGDGYNCSAEDIARIREVRYYSVPSKDSGLLAIPKYSIAKDAAKEFVKFMYSDTALSIWAQTMHSAPVAKMQSATIDTTGWLDFEKSAYELQQNEITVLLEAVGYKSKMLTKGGLQVWGTSSVITAMSQKERKDADDVWATFQTYVNTYWENALVNSNS